MGILGLGLDLCEIARIATAIQKQHFLERVFTPGERARIAQRGAQTAAGIYAAKEAAAKALGTGIDGFSLDALEVLWDDAGQPRCELHGRALELMRAMGGTHMRLSITHEAGMAAAVAILSDQP
ncbi:MAG: holo-ACP synthase [Clostridia bacterium]